MDVPIILIVSVVSCISALFFLLSRTKRLVPALDLYVIPIMDKSDPSLHLMVTSFLVYIAQYAAGQEIPPTVFHSDMPFLSVTRSPGETTLLFCTTGNDQTPATALASLNLPQPGNQDGPYAALRVRGPLDLSEQMTDFIVLIHQL